MYVDPPPPSPPHPFHPHTYTHTPHHTHPHPRFFMVRSFMSLDISNRQPSVWVSCDLVFFISVICGQLSSVAINSAFLFTSFVLIQTNTDVLDQIMPPLWNTIRHDVRFMSRWSSLGPDILNWHMPTLHYAWGIFTPIADIGRVAGGLTN